MPSQGCDMYVLWQARTLWTSLPPEERNRQKHQLASKVQASTCCRRRPWWGQQWIWVWLWLKCCVHACCGWSKVTWSVCPSIVSPKRRQQSILRNQRQSWHWCHGILHANFHAFKNWALQKRSKIQQRHYPRNVRSRSSELWTCGNQCHLQWNHCKIKILCNQTGMCFHSWSWILQRIRTCDYCTCVHTTKHIFGAMPCWGCTHHWRIRGWLWQSSKEVEETPTTWKEDRWPFGGPQADLPWYFWWSGWPLWRWGQP